MCREARAADEEAKNDPNHTHVLTRNHRCQVRFIRPDPAVPVHDQLRGIWHSARQISSEIISHFFE